MGSVKARLWAGLTASLFLLGADCGSPDDCYPFEVGDALRLTLVEPYDEDTITLYRPGSGDTGGVPSCDGFDGLVPGAEIDLRLEDKVDKDPRCETYPAVIEAGAPVPEASSATSPGSVGAVGPITTADGCMGSWSLSLVVDTEEPLGDVVAGEEPPVTVRREFETDAVETCPMFPSDTGRYLCIDVFVGTLAPR